MFNTKKTVRQDIHENEVAYSGSVTAVTPPRQSWSSSRHSMSMWMSSVTQVHPSRTVLPPEV